MFADSEELEIPEEIEYTWPEEEGSEAGPGAGNQPERTADNPTPTAASAAAAPRASESRGRVVSFAPIEEIVDEEYDAPYYDGGPSTEEGEEEEGEGEGEEGEEDIVHRRCVSTDIVASPLMT